MTTIRESSQTGRGPLFRILHNRMANASYSPQGFKTLEEALAHGQRGSREEFYVAKFNLGDPSGEPAAYWHPVSGLKLMHKG
jgi:hypothetical protein